MSNTVQLSQNTQQHYKNIDVLRGIAILAVIIVHCTLLGGNYAEYFDKIASFGSFGVDLFFVISGFLITEILLRTKSKTTYFKNFYIRRTLRIFPLYYGFLILYLTILPLIRHTEPIDNQLYYWLYIPNFFFSFHPDKNYFFHLWSLAIEEQYYLVWPVVVRFLNIKTLIKLLIILITSSFLLRCYFVVQDYNDLFIWAFTPIRLEAIAIGSLIAIIKNSTYNELLKSHFLNNYFKWILVTIILGLFIYMQGFYWNAPIVQSVGILLMDVFFGLMIIKAINDQNWKNNLINKVFIQLGKYCYAIYMFHESFKSSIALKVNSFHFNAIGSAEPYVKIILIILITTIVSFLFALISWNLYEKWFVNLKDKLASN